MARKILLADDSVTAQNMGRKILADAGYEVITVNNGSAALKKIAELKPDVIILDVYMPGYSGLEVCQRLKDAQETSRVPVLLTVGKLEPFKPEEAKRVRADAFIVKPFEASELLSSLSKLEDKIVPRAETSKPGRFARVTASIEEARYDRTVASEEDKGWKDRISFPPKKKEKAASEEEDDAAIASGRSSKPAEKLQPPKTPKTEETRVDLGALAPEGLPKDVTPEEIAALAAAAAQVKGKILDSGLTKSAAVETKSEREFQPEAPAAPQELAAAPLTVVPEPKYEEKSAPEAQGKLEKEEKYRFDAETRPAEINQEQIKQEETKGKIEEKVEDKAATIHSAPTDTVEPPMLPATSAADVVAAIAGLNPYAGGSTGATLGDEFSARGVDSAESQPVTMALAATNSGGTDSGRTNSGTATRWQAVSLALAPEDTSISLEHEMQKAHAAFAAASNPPAIEASATPVSAISASATPESSIENPPATESSASAELSLSETRGTDPATTNPDAAQPMSALSNSSTEAIRAAVQEMEMVAEPYVDGRLSSPQSESASSSVSAAEETNLARQTSVQLPEASAPEIAAPVAIEPPTATANLDTATLGEPVAEVQQNKTEDWKHENPASNDAKTEDRVYEDRKSEDVKSEDPQNQDNDRRNDDRPSDDHENDAGRNDNHPSEDRLVAAIAATPLEKMEEKGETVEPQQEAAAPNLVNPVSDEQPSASHASSEASAPAGEPTLGEPVEESRGETTGKESDETANPAAAWASWRRIRESDPPNSNSQTPTPEEHGSAPQEAAMAVAAGAEKTPDEGSPESDTADIANIVDSVLADLRPKIFEEISRKMGKKK